MKSIRVLLIAALSPVLALALAAQTPGPVLPSPTPGAATSSAPAFSAPLQTARIATHNSRVSVVVHGPQGEIQAFTLRNGIAVSLPPGLGTRLQSSITKGVRVQVSGIQQVIAGQTELIVRSITANGQTFIASPPAPDQGPRIAGGAPPPAGLQGPGDPRGRRGAGLPRRHPTEPLRHRLLPLVRVLRLLPLSCRGTMS